MLPEHHLVPYSAQHNLGRGPVVVFAPHPDDETLGCGGAIMRHLEAADAVTVIIVTDGAFGPAESRHSYEQIRQRETRSAATILGYSEPIFWGFPDRGLAYGEALIDQIRDCIEVERASLVYAPSWWEIHPDHRILSLSVAEAIRRCHHEVALLMYEVGSPLQPNRLLDITDLNERKQAAIRCFESQLASQAYDQHTAALNRFRTYTLPGSIKYAEAYRLVTRQELLSETARPGIRNLLEVQEALLTQLHGIQTLLMDRIEQTPTLLDLQNALDPGRPPGEDHINSQVQRLQDDLDAVLHSTSWRITAPFRAMARLVKNKRR